MRQTRRVILTAGAAGGVAAWLGLRAEAQETATPVGVARIRAEAAALRPLVSTELAKRFLDATASLPAVAPRTLYRDPDTKALLSASSRDKLPEARRSALQPVPISEERYYDTKYGSPLAYVRALELLGRNGVRDLRGRRVLDFGYGTVGHLRLLALLGADAVGIDVDPFLRELYSEPGDTGQITDAKGRAGNVTLIDGRFPADDAVKRAVGGGYDLILSKNTLKRGYVHPERPADPRTLIDLGAGDAEFLRELFTRLKPGGHVLLYNLSPAPAPPDKPYIPWADGRSPFSKELWEAAGFRVLAFDTNDDEAARALGHALKWDTGPGAMDLQTNLFAHYTLARKPTKP